MRRRWSMEMRRRGWACRLTSPQPTVTSTPLTSLFTPRLSSLHCTSPSTHLTSPRRTAPHIISHHLLTFTSPHLISPYLHLTPSRAVCICSCFSFFLDGVLLSTFQINAPLIPTLPTFSGERAVVVLRALLVVSTAQVAAARRSANTRCEVEAWATLKAMALIEPITRERLEGGQGLIEEWTAQLHDAEVSPSRHACFFLLSWLGQPSFWHEESKSACHRCMWNACSVRMKRTLRHFVG